MPPDRILVLGGTGEARDLADALLAEGFHPVTSLAGVTRSPVLQAGEVRRGGFGGVEGLVAYIVSEHIAAVADATHPFATRISRHGHDAARRAKVPYVRLERPAWEPEAGDRWMGVATVTEAAAALPRDARALVTIGRKEIAGFFARPDVSGVARMIEQPSCEVPANWTLLLARPPFTADDEAEIIARHGITHVVTKNAGGEDTRAKLIAARQRKIPVIMVRRPSTPDAPSFSSVNVLVPALRRMLSP